MEENEKKEKSFIKNVKNGLILMLGGQISDKKSVMEIAEKMMDKYAKVIAESAIAKNPEFHEKYLFDFKKGFRSGGFEGGMMLEGMEETTANGSVATLGMQNEIVAANNAEPKKEETIKVAVKPIDVLNELEVIPNPFSLELLDEKISVLKDKKQLIKQEYTKRELKGLIERLDNRKKYNEHKAFFDQYKNTDEDKIKDLLTKHKLEMHESDIFIPEFPTEAVKIMKDYSEKVKLICGKEPVYYVISEAKDFKKKEKKRDPILLVQSPFGFFYQILGAWDKELIYLNDL